MLGSLIGLRIASNARRARQTEYNRRHYVKYIWVPSAHATAATAPKLTLRQLKTVLHTVHQNCSCSIKGKTNTHTKTPTPQKKPPTPPPPPIKNNNKNTQHQRQNRSAQSKTKIGSTPRPGVYTGQNKLLPQ